MLEEECSLVAGGECRPRPADWQDLIQALTVFETVDQVVGEVALRDWFASGEGAVAKKKKGLSSLYSFQLA